MGGEHGLHARPAAAVVRAAAGLDAEVRLENVTAGRGPAGARSLTALVDARGAARPHGADPARGPGAAEALAAVAALVAEDDGAAPPRPRRPPAARPRPRPRGGRGAARGRGLAGPGGRAGAGRRARRAAPVPDAPGRDARARSGPPWRGAREAVAGDLGDLRASAAERAGPEAADILDAQLLLLGDEALVEASEAAIATGAPAARAWDDAVRSAARDYEGLDDDYLRARGTDLLDVGRRVLERLAGSGPDEARGGEPAVLVADEVGAADAAAMDPERVAGMATAAGGPTSHAAIIARALGVPAVAGLGPAILAVADGHAAAARRRRRDRRGGPGRRRPGGPRGPRAPRASAGPRPPASAPASRPSRATAATSRWPPTPARRGTSRGPSPRAPTASASSAPSSCSSAAPDAPGEDEQRAAYAEAATALGGRRLVLRTLDAGADKPLPYLGQPAEENPFLGVRGLRLSLARPELLHVQLRAALQAAAHAPLSIMFPMVSEAGELREALRLLERGARLAGGRRARGRRGRGGRDGGGPGGRPHGGRARIAGAVPFDRHQRPRPVHDGRRARQRRASRGSPTRSTRPCCG